MSDKRLHTGAIARVSSQFTTEPVVALDRRREELGYDALGEVEQQFQLPITGHASEYIAWTDVEILFDVEFYNAPNQRNVPYSVPQFLTGGVVESNEPVVVTAVVRQWLRKPDDADTIVGARVSVSVQAPPEVGYENQLRVVPYRGYVHVAFQGFGAPGEDGIDLDNLGD